VPARLVGGQASRARRPSAVGSSFSPGLPGAVAGAGMKPASCSLSARPAARRSRTRSGARGLRLRIGRASGSKSETSRSLIGSPARRLRICATTLSLRSASASRRSALARILAAVRLAFALRERASARALVRAPAATRRACRAEAASSLPVSPVSEEHLALRLARPPPQRPADRPQPPARGARAVPDLRLRPARLRRQPLPLLREHPHPVARQPRVGRVAHDRGRPPSSRS